MKNIKNIIISILGTSILSWLYFYFLLPPINLSTLSFYVFLFFILCSFGVINISLDSLNEEYDYTKFSIGNISVLVSVFIIIGAFLISLTGTKIFNAKSYANVMQIQEKDFNELPESDLNKLSLLDRESATNIGNSYLGNIDKVSQFKVSNEYRQITIKDQPYRVSPLEYSGVFQWLNNKEDGIHYYVKVNQTTGKAELVNLQEGMKYTSSSYFNQDVARYLRFKYPTKIFQDPSFEVDDEGNPYYVATTYETKFVLNSLDPNGVITVNPITGETSEYSLDNVPEWIDRVYSAENVSSRIDDYYMYQNGFLNTIFGKKDVKKTTSEYNYISIGSDIYFYSGISSVNADTSNLGFVLVNMRTRETTFYKVPSATESSAMSSARGEVQEKGYNAIAPILIKLNGEPYYLISLKDNSGLVKSYALVNAKDYQEVTVDNNVSNLIAKFTNKDINGLKGQDIEEVKEEDKIEGEISKVTTSVIKGNTVYILQISDKIYQVELNEDNISELAFIEVGQKISAINQKGWLINFKRK